MNETLVKIEPFRVIGEDVRGVTAGFMLPREQAEFVFLTRKQGSLSGNTYHEGTVSGTNPKVFLLLSGTISLCYRAMDHHERYEALIDGPAMIMVRPRVIHHVVALTDIIMLECNSLQDIQADRVKEEV